MKASDVLKVAKKARFIEAFLSELGMTVRLSKQDILSRLYMAHDKEIEVTINADSSYILIGKREEDQ